MLQGAGVGLRRAMTADFATHGVPADIDFFELAPENWIGVGGRLGRQLQAIADQRPIICHGLSLSIGGPAALDEDLVKSIGAFMDR